MWAFVILERILANIRAHKSLLQSQKSDIFPICVRHKLAGLNREKLLVYYTPLKAA